MTPFIGRKQELKELNGLLKKGSASMVVVTGRRRIGKSSLIAAFAQEHTTYTFSGLPPTDQATAQTQRNEFGWQLGKALGQLAFKDDDWNDLFLRLAQHTRQGRVIIVLDEISWMGSLDHSFLGKLKNAWDLEFKKNPQLILILCGSVSTWIEKNILSSTGFLGRVSRRLTLEELPLADCSQFWLTHAKKVSAHEKFKVLAVTGGVPKYLEEIKPMLTAEENIRELCFMPSGLLFNEFDQIFSDLFEGRSGIYKTLVEAIVDGAYTLAEMYELLDKSKTGVMSEYLDDLIKSGFLQRDYAWQLKTGKNSKLSTFRISDNYLRFYLKYVLPNRAKIKKGDLKDVSLTLLPGWEALMGLQFENLVLNNRRRVHDLLGIKPEDIVQDGPFFQRPTTRQLGCQIDYLLQTRFDTLYVCEIKFHRQPVTAAVINDVEQKIERMALSRNYSCRPVLIHVNGVTDDVLERQYFAQIIDFGQLLGG